MLFRSKTSPKTWDAWIYYHGGTYYQYYLISERYVCDGFGVATSTDGVAWKDHGWVLGHSDRMVRYLGSGSVWRNLDPANGRRFLCNYSEWRMDGERNVQSIFFAASDDLLTWHKAGDDLAFRIDEKYYRRIEPNAKGPWEDPRWDGICVVPAAQGGYHGYWTATPRDCLGFGYGTSPDGLHWKAEPPPSIDWGGTPSMYFIEVGGVERIGSRYYAMLGDYASVNCGMFSFVSDGPQGPFRPSPKNYSLLQNKSRMHAYFTRFLQSPDGILVNHHSIAEGDFSAEHCVVYYAPLKKAAIIDECLYLCWWPGNDRLKSRPLALSYDTAGLRFDPGHGLLFEGTADSSGHLIIGHEGSNTTDIRIGEDSVVEIGLGIAAGDECRCLERVDRQISFGKRKRLLLLLRHTMMELYINDILIQCYTMEKPVNGWLTFAQIEDVRSWSWDVDDQAG